MLSLLFAFDLITITLLLNYFGKKDPSILQDIIRLAKHNYAILLFYLGSFAIISSFVAIAAYYFYKYIPDPDPLKTDFDKWEKAMAIAISTAGFLGIAVTIKIWQDTDKRQINLSTLSLFEKFRDAYFNEIRNKAWIVRDKWNNQEGYKKKFEDAAFPVDMIAKKDAISKEVKTVRDLIEFFAILSGYTGSEDALRTCRFFYYGWWRPFLYEMADLHDQYYSPDITLEAINKDAYNSYKDAVSYRVKLKRMDYLCGLDKFSEKQEFHEYG